ncbi:hypothetical protein GCM10007920_45280 [Ciceribacter naphthalenivorans]|uniref:Uncharacterized protein n=2 Tax=Alphaproteobacteria TaxID=28211 RepID=A0A512HFH9_9HYPH|nr:hypothetical protein RNA01_11300 [Ciceribacter naphthalenivorans]GLR24734.1 hypothetical protein GCM10007920_45280 [Ciceribacter naphthalenivorans]GLT07590.1 hypothetical protein GCM10007926_45280 [Sphingomonas psychrolutea]
MSAPLLPDCRRADRAGARRGIRPPAGVREEWPQKGALSFIQHYFRLAGRRAVAAWRGSSLKASKPIMAFRIHHIRLRFAEKQPDSPQFFDFHSVFGNQDQ